jgi:hypothetical protein
LRPNVTVQRRSEAPSAEIMKLMFTRMELTAPLSNWMAGRFSAATAQ